MENQAADRGDRENRGRRPEPGGTRARGHRPLTDFLNEGSSAPAPAQAGRSPSGNTSTSTGMLPRDERSAAIWIPRTGGSARQDRGGQGHEGAGARETYGNIAGAWHELVHDPAQEDWYTADDTLTLTGMRPDDARNAVVYVPGTERGVQQDHVSQGSVASGVRGSHRGIEGAWQERVQSAAPTLPPRFGSTAIRPTPTYERPARSGGADTGRDGGGYQDISRREALTDGRGRDGRLTVSGGPTTGRDGRETEGHQEPRGRRDLRDDRGRDRRPTEANNTGRYGVGQQDFGGRSAFEESRGRDEQAARGEYADTGRDGRIGRGYLGVFGEVFGSGRLPAHAAPSPFGSMHTAADHRQALQRLQDAGNAAIQSPSYVRGGSSGGGGYGGLLSDAGGVLRQPTAPSAYQITAEEIQATRSNPMSFFHGQHPFQGSAPPLDHVNRASLPPSSASLSTDSFRITTAEIEALRAGSMRFPALGTSTSMRRQHARAPGLPSWASVARNPESNITAEPDPASGARISHVGGRRERASVLVNPLSTHLNSMSFLAAPPPRQPFNFGGRGGPFGGPFAAPAPAPAAAVPRGNIGVESRPGGLTSSFGSGDWQATVLAQGPLRLSSGPDGLTRNRGGEDRLTAMLAELDPSLSAGPGEYPDASILDLAEGLMEHDAKLVFPQAVALAVSQLRDMGMKMTVDKLVTAVESIANMCCRSILSPNLS